MTTYRLIIFEILPSLSDFDKFPTGNIDVRWFNKKFCNKKVCEI